MVNWTMEKRLLPLMKMVIMNSWVLIPELTLLLKSSKMDGSKLILLSLKFTADARIACSMMVVNDPVDTKVNDERK